MNEAVNMSLSESKVLIEKINQENKEINAKIAKELGMDADEVLRLTQITGLAEDGIVKVNMWTRIAREAGQYAAAKIREREAEMEQGIFDACDPQTYINDAAAKAIEIMEEHLAYFNYGKLAD